MMVITQAVLADIPQLVKLLEVLFEQEAEFAPNPDLQSNSLEKIILDPTIGMIFIARDQDRVLGMLSLLLTESTALGSPVALLEDMIVAPSCRLQGIGTKLIEYAIQKARQMGVKRFTLLTDMVNFQAQEFYQKLGFHKSTMIPYRLILDSDIKENRL